MPLKFEKGEFGGAYYVAGRIDYGWQVMTAVQLSPHVNVKAHFQQGLKNLYGCPSGPDYKVFVRNYNFGLSLGYQIFNKTTAKKQKK